MSTTEQPCKDCGSTTPVTLLQRGRCLECYPAHLARLAEQTRKERAAPTAQLEVQAESAAFDAREEAKKELARRELARRRYLPFVLRFNPDYLAGWVHIDICRRLEQFMEDVAAKKSPRLMLFMPPRHGKSQLVSKTLPAWVLGHHPEWEFICCSYSGALSMQFSRLVRTIMRDEAYQAVFKTRLDPDSQSVEQWMTTDGGGLVAAGVGGAITGKGAHVLVIDDPVKNREDADSEISTQNVWDWYTSTAYTRLAPGAGVLVIQTRWADQDLAGRLVAAQKEGGDQWEIVEYPAVALDDEPHRKKGEALHPERYDLEALARIRRAIGERDWWALYQQKPIADEGSYFTKDMIRYYEPEELPATDTLVYYTAWDLAIGEKEHNDWTVGITWAVDPQENYWIVDLARGRWDSLRIVEEILDMHARWRAGATGIEKGQIEMAIGPILQNRVKERKLWEFYHQELKTGRRDKQLRARSIQGLLRAGRVRFPRPDHFPWVNGLVAEMLRFPVGVHDDQVDALAWLGLMITEMATYIPPPPPPKKSWKDKLNKFVRNDPRGTSWLSA